MLWLETRLKARSAECSCNQSGYYYTPAGTRLVFVVSAARAAARVFLFRHWVSVCNSLKMCGVRTAEFTD